MTKISSRPASHQPVLGAYHCPSPTLDRLAKPPPLLGDSQTTIRACIDWPGDSGGRKYTASLQPEVQNLIAKSLQSLSASLLQHSRLHLNKDSFTFYVPPRMLKTWPNHLIQSRAHRTAAAMPEYASMLDSSDLLTKVCKLTTTSTL